MHSAVVRASKPMAAEDPVRTAAPADAAGCDCQG
jgi:hypothetical protein